MTIEKKYIVFDIETTGLNPWYRHPLTCICAKDSEGNIFQIAGSNEQEIIKSFMDFVKDRGEHCLISANGKDFDAPYIMARSYMLGIELHSVVNLLNKEHFDIFNITSRKISLNDLAVLFKCGAKTGNGFEAINLFNSGRLDELKKYCLDDVLLTEAIYKKYMELK